MLFSDSYNTSVDEKSVRMDDSKVVRLSTQKATVMRRRTDADIFELAREIYLRSRRRRPRSSASISIL